jgi:hypothetical protein
MPSWDGTHTCVAYSHLAGAMCCRFVFQVSLPAEGRLRQVLPGSAADVVRLKAFWAS